MKLIFKRAVARAVFVSTALIVGSVIPLGCGSLAEEPTSTTNQEIAGPVSITGTIFDGAGSSLSGVVVRLSGDVQATATTGSSGTYAFSALGRGSYSVQVSRSGCAFEPTVANLNDLSAGAVADFFGSGSTCGGTSANSGATAGSLTISGLVSDSHGNPIEGIKLALNGSVQGIRSTTAAGSYTFHVNPGSYSISPSGSCAFMPRVANVNDLTSSATRNFAGGAGCVGALVDAGADTGATEAGAGDARMDSGVDGTVDAGRVGGDAGVDGARDTGADVCAPSTCAAAGVNCGTLADGCGHTISCGTCAANQSCSLLDGGSAGMCVCSPLTTCPAGVCGSVSNGCGGTVTCSTHCTGHDTCQIANGGTSGTCGCQPTATACPSSDNCGSVDDGCGVVVPCGGLGGACASGLTCSSTAAGVPGTCGCTPATTCPTGVVCGTSPDGCGGSISCGSCASPTTCSSSGTKCICTPTITCASEGATCGTLTDNCGTVLHCGFCTAPQTSCAFSDGGTAGTCTCHPLSAAVACGTRNCGTSADGCGGTVSCGACNGTTQSCSIPDGGTAGTCTNVCVPLTSCPSGVCGSISDHCGGTVTCAACGAGQTCAIDGGSSGACTSNVCVPADTCASHHFTCGTFVDSCGVTETCGACAAPQTCGGGGTANVCGSSACAVFNNAPGVATSGCTATEQKFVNKSVDCYTCLVNGSCLDDTTFGDTGKECGDLTGNATGGVRAGTANSALCLAKIDCILGTSCASTDVAACYCGTLLGSACATSSAPGNGACAQAEVDGSNHLSADPASVVSPTLADVTLAAGKADAIFACANLNGCASLCSQ